MNILIIGDVVGSPGRAIVKKALPKVFQMYDVDYCICNVENAAGGFGVTREVCDEFLAMGVDCMTSGNHIWDKKEILSAIEQYPALIRPLNYPPSQPGKGWHIGRGKDTRTPVATLNLSGRVFMNGSIDDPFTLGMKEVERLRRETPVVIVDVHCEATSEKQALGHWFDGQVSAVVGTHTHVPTCDHRILSKGTAFVTDLGMTGPYDSVIGMEKENILNRFVHGISNRFEPAKNDARFAAAVVTVDPNTGKAKKIDRMLLSDADLDGL